MKQMIHKVYQTSILPLASKKIELRERFTFRSAFSEYIRFFYERKNHL